MQCGRFWAKEKLKQQIGERQTAPHPQRHWGKPNDPKQQCGNVDLWISAGGPPLHPRRHWRRKPHPPKTTMWKCGFVDFLWGAPKGTRTKNPKTTMWKCGFVDFLGRAPKGTRKPTNPQIHNVEIGFPGFAWRGALKAPEEPQIHRSTMWKLVFLDFPLLPS
jgi:hypothetical protein